MCLRQMKPCSKTPPAISVIIGALSRAYTCACTCGMSCVSSRKTFVAARTTAELEWRRRSSRRFMMSKVSCIDQFIKSDQLIQPLLEHVDDVDGLLRRLGLVARDQLQDDALGPLAEVLDAVEEVVDDRLVDCHAALGRQDLVECIDAVGDHLRVSVAQHRVELVDHVARGECVGGVVVHLEAGEDRRLAHVRRLVAQPRLDHPWEVLDDVWQAQRRERAEREPACHRVVVAAVFLERVDGEEREVRVGRRVVADVQVDHLFDHVVFG
mmetsp:Transcript_26283/g.84327  ORF Transcript_26283/g.84327 Transcript_26283/m.84327 type:complete len:268 (-) Transcript_26283:239-1042(-)